MNKILFWSLNFIKHLFSSLNFKKFIFGPWKIDKFIFFAPKLLEMFYFLFLKFTKSLFFFLKLLKKSFFFHAYFVSKLKKKKKKKNTLYKVWGLKNNFWDLFGLNLLLLKLKTENWKYYSKIIFKCANSAMRPIFNIFKCMNSTATVCEQCWYSAWIVIFVLAQ